MNKKFSTLVATLLLSGALFTLNAATFNDDVFKDKYQKEVVGEYYYLQTNEQCDACLRQPVNHF